MVILCPKCSTGFNLPEKHITPKGAKLRCSRCSHVFRVRSGLGDEPEIFYKPEDDAANAAQAAVDAPHEPAKTYAAPRRPSFDDDDEDDHARALGGATRMGVGGFEAASAGLGTQLGLNTISEVSSPNHKTQFGNPGIAEVSSPNHKTQFGAAARAALRDEEPGTMDLGPHVASPGDLGTSTQFGPGSIAATREKSNPKLPAPVLGKVGAALEAPPASQTLEWRTKKAEPTAQGLDLFGGDDDDNADPFAGPDPFAGAFELSSSAALQPKKKPRSMLFDDPAQDEEPAEPILRASAPARPAPREPEPAPRPADPAPSAPAPLRAALPVDVPEPAPETRPAATDFWSGNSAQETFGAQDMVDPSFGIDGPSFDPERGLIEQTSTPAPQHTAPARPLGGPPRQAAPSQLASGGPASRLAAPAAAPAPAVAAPHQIGGSGPQKVANIALIVLSVLFLFFGLLAGLNDMMLDFKRFGHMLEVGFGGEPFKPRLEWLAGASAAGGADAAPSADGAAPDAQPGVPTKPDVLQVRGVWAAVVPWTKKKEALLVRGQLHNADLQDYIDVRLRARILDSADKVIAEAEAPLGAWLTDAQIKGLGPAKLPASLVPAKSSRLATQGSAPFTIVFDEVPKQVAEGEQLSYRVEVIKRVGEKELTK
jgi:predicted Zn finger-like uncharacterized protein